MSKVEEQEILAEDQDVLHEDDSDLEEQETEVGESEGQDEIDAKKADVEPELEDTVEIKLGEESLTSEVEDSSAPDWVKDLRKAHREQAKQNRELRAKLAELEAKPKDENLVVGEKPKLESFDYDSDKYEAALADWFERKRKDQEKRQLQEAEQQKQKEEWQKKLDEYEQSKKALGVKDYEDSESVAMEVFDQMQQGIILQGADNPALAVYAIGKNSKRAKDLASIKDPVKFAFAVAKLEKDLKVTKVKHRPKPESSVTPDASAGGSDARLERLRKEADRTGDYSKVIMYRRQMKSKQ